MTVQPGRDWGEVVATPQDSVAVGSDAELADAIARGETRPLLLRGGDLLRTVGAGDSSRPLRPRNGLTSARNADASESIVRRLPIDVLRVLADGRERLAAAHVVVRPRGRIGWLWGPILALMNVEHIGQADVAPRAHPNDGRVDVVSVSAAMSIRARAQAWGRLASGTHVPHPAITVRRALQHTADFDRPLGLWIDGVDRGTVRSLAVSVVPDAAVVYA